MNLDIPFIMVKPVLKGNYELGHELDLYMTHELIGTGLLLFTPRGATILRELQRFIEDEEIKRGYQFTKTPYLSKTSLFDVSGHTAHYKDNMFIFRMGDETFALRPMTCPFQFMIYKSKPHSYRELPIKYAETSPLYRYEKKGELMGLTRLWQFTLSDAHVICRLDQVEEEFKKVLDLIHYVAKTLSIEDLLSYRFSKWDPKDKIKYVQNPKAWEETQAIMKRILDKNKINYREAEGEAAFYGPKLDIQAKWTSGKEDTIITVQIDFSMPDSFKLEYIDENNKAVRPIVIHRSSIGCYERTLALILEKFQGQLPLWLSPVQVKILSLSSKNEKKVIEIADKMRADGIRIEVDTRETTINAKIRDAELDKVPYTIVIGDKEEANNTLSVRKKGEAPKMGIKVDDFIKRVKKEIIDRI